MLFGELIKEQSWPLVEAALMLYFPKYQSSMAGFRRAFEALQQTEPLPQDGCLLTIAKSDSDFNVFVERGGEKSSMSFFPWAEVLGLTIENQTFARFSQTEITALVLWTITFLGFDEETIRKKTDEWLKELK